VSAPYGQVTWLVGNQHVTTPLDDVAADIRERCRRAGLTSSDTGLAVAHARRVHLKNRVTYLCVQWGRLGKLGRAEGKRIREAAKRMG
jgi:hypothetical protein